jgi:hypothetical protein
VKSDGVVAETMMEAERKGHSGDEAKAPSCRVSALGQGEVVRLLQWFRQGRKAPSPSRLLTTLNTSASLDRRQRSTSASLRCVVRYTAGSHHCQPECSWLSCPSPALHAPPWLYTGNRGEIVGKLLGNIHVCTCREGWGPWEQGGSGLRPSS